MNQRAATWGDVIDYRGGSRFVGRRGEIEAFRLNCLYDVPQSLLFVIQGAPGIGKTALLAQYRAIAREHGVVTAGVSSWDVLLTEEFAAVQTMSTLAQQLKSAGMPLVSFSEMLLDYEKALQAIAGDESAPGQSWGLLGGVFDDDEWASRAWDEYLFRTFPARHSEFTKNPVDTLTERFVQDLNAWATVRKIVICFDDWHHCPSYLDTWMLDLLRKGDLATGIWLVLATGEPLTAGWEGLASVTTASELQPLSSAESRALLLGRGVMEEQALDQRSALGLGHPMALELLAATPGPVVGSAGLSIIDRFLGGMQADRRDAVLKCVAARRVDDGVLSALFANASGSDPDAGRPGVGVPQVSAQAGEMAKWLVQSSLVTQSPTGWRFRPAIYEDLTHWARTHTPAIWQMAHQTLYAYYRRQLELRGPAPQPAAPTASQHASQYLDPVWQRDQIEALYHGIAVDEGLSALNAVFLSFAQGLRHFYPWAGSVVSLLWSAAKIVPAERDIAGWAESAGSILDALLARKWEQVLPMIDGVLDSQIWTPEVKQVFRGLRQLVAARLSLSPEPEALMELSVADVRTTRVGVGSEESRVSAVAAPASDAASATDKASVSCELPLDDAGALTGAVASGVSATNEDVSQVEGSAVEHCSYANAQLAAGTYEAAIQAYDQALALSPDYVAAHYNRGLAYARLGALDGAIADFARVIELDAGQVQAYHQRGLVYARKRKYERAVSDYDMALSLRPDSVALIYDRAIAFFRLSAYERAIQDCTTVLEKEPNRVDAYLNRGLAYAAIKDYPEALRNYNQAIALDPGRAVSYSRRGKAYARLERYTEALADYERALEINPRDAVVHNNRGLLYVRIEAYAQAIESYRQAMALHPDWATSYYNGACAAALSADAEQACVWLSRAVGLRERYRAMAMQDADFAAMRDHPGFQTIVQGDHSAE
jgi:tetratricopeptide (TPR) repeat protein